jgi:hypothetical protein
MIENFAARQRAEALAATKRRSQRQHEAVFWGGQGASFSGGGSIPATTGSNGPLRLGQSAPLMQVGGSAQIDTFSAALSDEPLNPVRKGGVAVLARVEKDGLWQLWLGGDRKTPVLIADNLPERPTASLELSGSGKNDWAIAIQHGSTIAMRYGRQDPQTQRVDWTITNPICSRLSYMGGGFWAANRPFAYPIGNYAFSEFQESLDLFDPVPGLGSLVEADCHPQVDGPNSTIAVPYCESIYIDGSVSATHTGFDRRLGFDPSLQIFAEYPYSGTNEIIAESTLIAEWEGTAQGSNPLGEPNVACTLGTQPILGTSLYPRLAKTLEGFRREALNTQSYSFSAYGGEILASIGTHAMNQTASDNGIIAAGGPKKIDYIGECTAFTTGNFWTIGITNSESWQEITLTQNSTQSDFTASYSNNVLISPTISKPFEFSAIGTDSTQLDSSSEYAYPFTHNSDGLFTLYQQEIIEGESYLYSIEDPSFPRYVSGFRNFKQFLVYNGNEYELGSDMPYSQTTWQSTESIYPVGYTAEYNYDSNNDPDILKTDVKFDIFKRTGTLTNNQIVYENEGEKVSSKRAFSLKILGDTAEILDIKYWQK